MRRGIAIALIVSACGGAPAYVVHARQRSVLPPGDGPLAPALNQNAPPPTTSADVELPRVILWCSQPEGDACLAAQAELGIVPSPAEMIPPVWLTAARDLDDDCSDPDVASTMERIASAVRVTPGRWTDRGGQLETTERIEDPVAGSGCANEPLPGESRLHVHASDLEGAPRLLVRVWEYGDHSH